MSWRQIKKDGPPVFVLAKDGCTTACIVITPFGSSPNGILHCPTVLLFSKIFPALINLTSFAAFGAIFLSENSCTLFRTSTDTLAEQAKAYKQEESKKNNI